MSETKWTPGPWVLDQRYHGCIYSDDLPGSIVAQAGGFEFAPRLEAEETANACLIAAAPDLYEALNNLTMAAELEIVLGNKAWVEMHGIAMAVLKKARGEA